MGENKKQEGHDGPISLTWIMYIALLIEMWPFFDLAFVVRFHSIIFEGVHWFHSNFAKLIITVKYKSSSTLVIICQILAELWPFFELVFVGVLILVSDQ